MFLGLENPTENPSNGVTLKNLKREPKENYEMVIFPQTLERVKKFILKKGREEVSEISSYGARWNETYSILFIALKLLPCFISHPM